MKSFDYIFYRVCDFYKKKKDSTAEFTSSLIISLLQFFTIVDAFVFVRIIWEYPIPENFTKFWTLLLLIPLQALSWNKYIRIRKYRIYRKMWKDENIQKKRIKGILIVIYLIFSILIPILYGLIRHNLMDRKSYLG